MFNQKKELLSFPPHPKGWGFHERYYMKEYIKYRDKKKLDNICKWFNDIDFEMEYLDSYGHFSKEMFITDFINVFG